jgi:cell wall-associated NlpC family hydrolase
VVPNPVKESQPGPFRYIAPIGLLPLICALSFVALAVAPSTLVNPVTLCGSLSVGSALPDGTRLSSEQAANASIIVAVAEQQGAGTAGAVDAVDAAFTEARLINVPTGDRDSLGLFQERPSQGWGTPAQILNPVYATGQFLNHLMALPSWQDLAPASAAQAVERSAFPDRYQQWIQPANQLVAGLSGSGGCTNADATSRIATALPAGYSLPAGTPSPVITAIQYALAQLGKPYVWGGIGPDAYDCSGLTMQAYLAAGFAIPRTTYAQVYAGQSIYTTDQLAPGDLLFIEGTDPGPGGAPGHVGMYIGAGTIIDAPHAGATVQLTDLSGWIHQLVAIRRIVPS